jgi:hypothetical protein
MAGKRQKSPDDLVFKRGGRYQPNAVYSTATDDEGRLIVIGEDGQPALDGEGQIVYVEVPDCPDGVDEYAQGAWRNFWLSPVSQLANMEAHGVALEHWIRLVDQRQRLWLIYKDQPLVVGSHRQPMTNPIWRQVRDLDEEIMRYEESFGMTPLAQMRLGVEFLTGQALHESLRGDPHAQRERRPAMISSND